MNVIDLDDTTAPLSSKNNSAGDKPNSAYTPDELTKERFKNLAIVGRAIMQSENENSYQSDFYIAQQALDKFVGLYDLLLLDPEDRAGMDDLIKYLRGKIERRLNASLKIN